MFNEAVVPHRQRQGIGALVQRFIEALNEDLVVAKRAEEAQSDVQCQSTCTALTAQQLRRAGANGQGQCRHNRKAPPQHSFHRVCGCSP